MNGQTTPKRFNPRPGQNRIPRSPKLTRTTPQDSATKSILDRDDEYSSPLKTPTKPLTAEGETNQQRTTPKKKPSQKKEIKQPVKSVARNMNVEPNFVKHQMENEKLATDSGSIKVISQLNLSRNAAKQKNGQKNPSEVPISASNTDLMTFGLPSSEIHFKKRFLPRKRAISRRSDSSESSSEEVKEVGQPQPRDIPKAAHRNSQTDSQLAHRGSDTSDENASRQETNEMSPFSPAIDAQRAHILDLDQNSRRRGITIRELPGSGAGSQPGSFKRKILMLQFVLEANGGFAKTWASINTILLISVGIFTPIRAGIMKDERADYIYVIEKITDAFFFFDILVNFITPVIVDRDKVSDLGGIAKTYLKSWFFVDFISFLPVDEIMSRSNLPERWSVYARLLRGFKLVKLFKIFKAHETHEIGSDNFVVAILWSLMENELQFTMIVWSVWMILVVHIFSCFWYWMGKFNDGKSWGYVNNFSNESNLDFYISACYFIMQTFSSTGYGDIASKNSEEIGFRIIIIIIGGILYTMFTGKLAIGISDLVTLRESVSHQLEALNRIAEEFQLDSQTYQRLKYSIRLKLDKNYSYTARHNELKEVFTMKQADDAEADRECYVYCNHALGKLKDMPFFRPLPTNSSLEAIKKYSSCMRKLFTAMKVRRYEAGQYIYCKGDSARTFYIIESGSVGFCQSVYGEEFVFSKICINKPEATTSSVISDFRRDERTHSLQTTSNNIHEHHKRKYIEGGYFGEIELLAEGVDKREFTVKAINNCIIHSIDVEEYMRILYDHSSDSDLAKSIEAKTLRRMQAIHQNLQDFKQGVHSRLKLMLEKKFSAHISEELIEKSDQMGIQNPELSSDVTRNVKDVAVAKIWDTLDKMLFTYLSPDARPSGTMTMQPQVNPVEASNKDSLRPSLSTQTAHSPWPNLVTRAPKPSAPFPNRPSPLELNPFNFSPDAQPTPTTPHPLTFGRNQSTNTAGGLLPNSPDKRPTIHNSNNKAEPSGMGMVLSPLPTAVVSFARRIITNGKLKLLRQQTVRDSVAL